MKIRENMKWIGTVLFAIGAISISVSPVFATEWWPFAAFFFGHIIWLTVGLLMKDKAIVFMNMMYLPFDIYAVMMRF